MPIINKDNSESYIGCVLSTYDHFWMDGMMDEYATVYDAETDSIKSIQVGYYGSDGCNLLGMGAKIDYTTATARAVIRHYKKSALQAFENSVIAEKSAIHKNDIVKVIRGRKVKKGTQLQVFWIGEKPTYQATKYSWCHDTELIAGCYDENGCKVWILSLIHI